MADLHLTVDTSTDAERAAVDAALGTDARVVFTKPNASYAVAWRVRTIGVTCCCQDSMRSRRRSGGSVPVG